MGILIMIGQLFLGLSIMVGLHELGHLLTAKLFGMRVEIYSIGFFPKIFSRKIGDTEYAIGAIPLGGFVKISGMIDESMDTETMNQPAQPYEFRSKPAWQRLIVMLGGIIVNIITGIMMFVGLVYFTGESFLPSSEVKHGIVAHELGEEVGLKTGDKIVKVNGKPFTKYEEILSPKVLLSSNSYYTVEREGKNIEVDLPNNLVEKLSKERFVEPQLPFSVLEIAPNSPASKAGLQKGDVFVKINDQKITYFHELQSALKKYAGKKVNMEVLRNDKNVSLQAEISADGKLGFSPKIALNYQTQYFGIGEATLKGTEQAYSSLVYNLQGIGKMFRGEVSTKSVSGPIGIAKVFGDTWDWVRFWRILAVLSIWIAFMNLLPIPALDGGHVMFLLYEIIAGRKPSDSFLTYAQMGGMIILLALMVFVIGNDIFNLIF